MTRTAIGWDPAGGEWTPRRSEPLLDDAAREAATRELGRTTAAVR